MSILLLADDCGQRRRIESLFLYFEQASGAVIVAFSFLLGIMLLACERSYQLGLPS